MTSTTPTTPYTEAHSVTLVKPAKRSLQEKVLTSNLNGILASITTRALAVRGWKVEPRLGGNGKAWKQKYAYGKDYEYTYEMYLAVTFTREDGGKPETHELAAILKTIATRVTQPAFGRWLLGEVDDQPYNVGPASDDEGVSADSIGYAPVAIPDDWSEHFAHLYGLDAQITMIRRALEAGDMSQWANRYHCALVGPPGCGKSDICQSIKRALGEDAVMEFDATATTSAGAIKELSEREILPRVIIIEEIEKAPEASMQFLLGVLDLRSQIRKTTARSTIVRDTKMFAIATVNDIPLFEKLQAGALASRFANTIAFRRPSRDQLRMILEREVKRVEGDVDWIDPTLDYCDEQGITDPRRVTAICLCGRDMLVTGEYQKLLSATTEEREGK